MNLWLWAASGILAALVPCGVVCFHGPAEDRLVGLEMAANLVALELLLFAEGFHRSFLFDLPLALALLSFGSAMVFTRFIQRWL